MANYSPLYHNTFHDRKFKKLSMEAKLLFLFLIGNGGIGLTGIYDLDPDVTNLVLGLSKSFEAGMQELVSVGMVKWDAENNIVWVVNRFKLLVAKNSKVIVGALNEITNMDHPFKSEFIAKYKEILSPFLYKVQEQAPSSLIEESQLHYLVKIYSSKHSLKRFLMDRGVTEVQVDRAIEKHLPALK